MGENMKPMFVVILAVILLPSCASSANVIYDESIPLEKTSLLHTWNQGYIVGYNGVEVNWRTRGKKLIQIPAGDTLLEWDLNTYASGSIVSGKGILFRYNFQPQKQYVFVTTRKDMGWGLGFPRFFGQQIRPHYYLLMLTV